MTDDLFKRLDIAVVWRIIGGEVNRVGKNLGLGLDDKNDLFSAAMLACIEKHRNYKPDRKASLSTYLTMITRYSIKTQLAKLNDGSLTFSDYARRRRQQVGMPFVEQDDGDTEYYEDETITDPADLATKAADLEAIMDWIDTHATKREKACFEAFYLQDDEHVDLAAIGFDISAERVKQIARRTAEKIKEFLK